MRGGVHPLDGQHGGKSPTSGSPIRPYVPKTVYIPMSQFLGKPSTPLVKAGDHVKLGQVIGEAAGFMSLPAHATVSGQVVSVAPKMLMMGAPTMTITIENDMRDEWTDLHPLGKNVESVDPAAIVPAIQAAGICGLGGATFPTHVKLTIPEGKRCDSIIINGAECETHVTADHRLMLESPERIVNGLRLAMRAVGVKYGIIAIEDNKKDAIKVMREAIAGIEGLHVMPLYAKYPQGSEKQLIYAVTGFEVPSKMLPIDVGVVVLNTGTAAAISDAVLLGKPLVQRVTTVTGCVKEPANLLVRIGTPIVDAVEACGGYSEEPYKMLMGGCMTGICVPNDTMPISKGNNCIAALTEKEAKAEEEGPCIRCGRCVDVCPIGLQPYRIKHFCDQGDLKGAEASDVMECVVCGCCSYICPARRTLTASFKNTK
ncbi:MAG: electron transport complex subunit RsxC, partial [Clostridia bacterium]|nr:electron transport complex subunit RsxC [Clostridia bacterium]